MRAQRAGRSMAEARENQRSDHRRWHRRAAQPHHRRELIPATSMKAILLRGPRRPVGARRCRGADTCAGRRRGPGQGRHNRCQRAGSVGAQRYLCLAAPLPAIPGIELSGRLPIGAEMLPNRRPARRCSSAPVADHALHPRRPGSPQSASSSTPGQAWSAVLDRNCGNR